MVTPHDERHLNRLAARLARTSQSARMLSYPDVEEAAERLAALLIDRCGLDQLRSMRVVPIPRGGLIVAGLVSYLLDLPRHQLEPEARGLPLIVDDIGITGKRLRTTLDRTAADGAVVALLAAPAGLVEAVEQDPRVAACVAAITLEDKTADLDPSERAIVHSTWAERLGDDRYWPGLSRAVVFPWGAPESLVWDSNAERLHRSWQIRSPEGSIKARGRLGPPSADRTKRSLRFPAEVAHGHFEDHSLVCLLESGDVIRLNETATAMWGALGTLGDPDLATRHLAERWSMDADELAGDVAAARKAFLAAGLLVENV